MEKYSLQLTDADNGDPVLRLTNTGTGATEPEIRFERAHPAVSGSSPENQIFCSQRV